MQRVSAINIANIHQIVFEIPCLQNYYTQTDRGNRIHNHHHG